LEEAAAMRYVFISYSHSDHEYVARLSAHLRSAGLEVWTDEGIDYGDHWPDVIESRIESCSVFICVMSDYSRKARWVDREIDLAQELALPIVPLLCRAEGSCGFAMFRTWTSRAERCRTTGC
jgi:hypothetical protein